MTRPSLPISPTDDPSLFAARARRGRYQMWFQVFLAAPAQARRRRILYAPREAEGRLTETEEIELAAARDALARIARMENHDMPSRGGRPGKIP
jgi:hypothetical protein